DEREAEPPRAPAGRLLVPPRHDDARPALGPVADLGPPDVEKVGNFLENFWKFFGLFLGPLGPPRGPKMGPGTRGSI
ncbi:MAG: hypothetical protein VXZ92_12820, partial [SAR324 cluster bacterium]|nr:hypothetical protein [SAR324 cluster bacterium]